MLIPKDGIICTEILHKIVSLEPFHKKTAYANRKVQISCATTQAYQGFWSIFFSIEIQHTINMLELFLPGYVRFQY